MSTNIDHPNIPDEKVLERMANDLFKGDDGMQSQEEIRAPSNVSQPARDLKPAEANGVNVHHPQTSLHDPLIEQRAVPKSDAGRGISPAVGDQVNRFQANNPQTSLPDSRTTTHGTVPGSVAGSGISPSVVEHGKIFNLNEPQTSHLDPHLGSPGVVPASLAGSGVSSTGIQGKQESYDNTFPMPGPYTMPAVTPPSVPGLGISPSAFQNLMTPGNDTQRYSGFPMSVPEQSYETELQQKMNAMFRDAPANDLSFMNMPGVPDPSFYFLPQRTIPGFGNDEASGARSYLTLKEQHSPNRHSFDANLVKRDFPILQERVNGKSLVWLDNAATTQKPKQVIDRISYFYEHENSNIHRAAHELAARATDAYEGARKKVQEFIHAKSPNEIIFVRGATEAINLVAKSWGDQFLKSGDEIVLSHLEHHANIVPWQQLAWKKGLKILVIPVDDSGQIIMDEYGKLLGPKTKLVSFTQVSNALGTVTPAKQMVDMAHLAGAKVLVDGAQSVSHMPVDVQLLDADWFVFSGHKVFGPTGIGVVYGKEAILNETQPWQGGGNMIIDVTFEHTKYHNAPGRFEAGTGNIADAVGLGAAIDYVSRLGMESIHQYETYLLHYATMLMTSVPGLRMIGTASEKASVLSFVFEGFRPDEVGVALNEEGIAVRAGHHCAQPILRRFGVETTIRPSLAFYNTCSDVDRMVATLFRLRDSRPLKKSK